MLEDLTLPPGLGLARTTPEFDSDTVPAALLSAHRIARGVWGLLCVRAGSLEFVVEETEDSRVVSHGESQVIEPEVAHHIRLGSDARFVIEFHSSNVSP